MTVHSGCWDIVVVGGCNADFLVRGSRLPKPGETVEGSAFQQAPGGKGANQAVAASRLGARVAMIGRVGSDQFGDEMAQNLQDEGVDVRHLMRDKNLPSGIALIMVDQHGEKQILTAPGANRQLALADVAAAETTIRSAKVVLAQLELPVEIVHWAMNLGREAGARTVLDPAPAVPLSDELLRLVDVIRPNAAEAEVLTGIQVHNRISARQAASYLLDRGAKGVVVQAGDEGDLLVWAEGEELLPRFPVESIDATGAGDAFAASLAVMLAEDRTLMEAGRFASAAAALATTKVGAQAGLPRRHEVESLLATARGALPHIPKSHR